MRVLDVIRSNGISPARDLAIQRHLLAQMERAREGGPTPALHLAWLSGSALALGRFQRRSSALRSDGTGPSAALPVVRRPTGGRAVWMGEGQLSVSLVMPDTSALLPPDSLPIGSDKIINRYVRGVLGGLQSRGFKAYYFGRDFLSINRKLGGYLSFEVAPKGATLMHALIGVSRPTALPAGTDGYPGVGGNRPDPEPTTLAEEQGGAALDRATLESAIVDAYVRNQQTEARDRALSPLEETLLGEREAGSAAGSDELEEAGQRPWAHSDLKPVACGWLEASVHVVQERFIGAARIFGDFMTASATIERIDRELRLVPIDWRAIGLIVDRVVTEPGSALAGVRYLRVIPDALVEAAARAGGTPQAGPPGELVP